MTEKYNLIKCVCLCVSTHKAGTSPIMFVVAPFVVLSETGYVQDFYVLLLFLHS